jgi:PGF-pre-PGF domain-containing protein
VNNLVITQPSANETTFAEMRDFYVYGIFPNSPLGTPGNVEIELFHRSSCTFSSPVSCTGSPLRQIQSNVDPIYGTTNQSCLNLTFVNGVSVKGGYVPDIVENPDGSNFTDPNNKVVVTDRYYAGLVLGGVNKTYNTTYKDSSGTPLQDLIAGDYTILVIGLDRSLAGQVVAENISFGITNTALGTNRPPDNKNARVNYAIQHNLRTYFDSFPGYFSDGGSNWSNFVVRAYANNGIEVVNDLSGTTLDTIAVANNTMFMYNINSASTTYSVELAPILRYNLQDSANTTFLYYSNGEPFLTYNDTTGTPRNVASMIIPFTGTNRLALTRVEVRALPSSSYENLYDPNDAAQKTVYTDLSGGVTLNQRQEFIVFGVTKPIASTVGGTSYPYWYTIGNRTSQIAYTITNSNGGTVLTASHDVNLSRYYSPGSTTRYNSLFEFGSEFSTLTAPGTYHVSLVGKDMFGNTVPGTSASFSVTVLPTPVPPEGGGPDAADSGRGSSYGATSPGAPAGQAMTFTLNQAVTANAPGAFTSVSVVPSVTLGSTQMTVADATTIDTSQLADRQTAYIASIEPVGVNPSSISQSTITFAVAGSWLSQHGVNPQDIVLMRDHNGQWSELTTSFDHQAGNTYYFTATTPGFSYFAITTRVNAMTGNTTTVTATPTVTVITNAVTPLAPTTVPTYSRSATTPVTTQTTAVPASDAGPAGSTGIPVLAVITGIVGIVIVTVGGVLVRRWWIRRQNPALFRKYD